MVHPWPPRRLLAALIPFMCLAWFMRPCAAEEAAPPLPADHAQRMAAGLALFQSEVRDILARHCVDCHGGKETEGKFDLTTREGLLKGGADGPAIELWNGEASRLYRLITRAEEPEMPQDAPKLADAQIAAIAKWIDLGAPYDKPLKVQEEGTPWTERVVPAEAANFWAFRPLRPLDPSSVDGGPGVTNPIDRLVGAKLREKGLAANGPASRRELVRRLYFDLTGLPPTTEEVEAFERDDDPGAYHKLVGRLLDSPRYGERWARHWLDVARFGESDGGEMDSERPHAYAYRDFVIRAFNDDMPFDQFIRWQLAGDEFAPGDPLALAATGFLVAGTFPPQLTETEFEPARYDQLDDMAATTGLAFLGLSVGCARCHDHKFDPLPSRDYYQFLSAFTTTIRSEVEVDASTPEERRQADAKYAAQLARLEAELKKFQTEQLPARFAEFVRQAPPAAEKVRDWTVLDVSAAETAAGTRLDKQTDGSYLAVGTAPNQETYTLTAQLPTGRVTALRIEALTHDSLPHRGPGRADNGNFCLSDLSARTTSLTGRGGGATDWKFASARASHEQNGQSLSVASSLDGDKDTTGWAVDQGGIGRDQSALFTLAEPWPGTMPASLCVVLRFAHPNARHALGRLRLSVTSADAPSLVAPAPADSAPVVPPEIGATIGQLRAGAAVEAAPREAALAWFAATVPEIRRLEEAITKQKNTPPGGRREKIQIASENVPKLFHHAAARGFPYFYPETHFLKRGDPSQKQGVAQPSYLQVLMRGGKDATYWQEAPGPGTTTSLRRRALAKWMTDIEFGAGPLAARVAVNRLWQHHFGRGIVATPNDFGATGTPPSHPELLEWLAGQLVASGWRLKPIHQMIVESAAYQRSAAHVAEAAAGDPENQFWSRREPRRLEAEAIRDSLLAVSGQLDPRMFGPGDRGEDSRRRSIYFHIRRSQFPVSLQLFDAPEPLVSQGARPTTTIAPQALLIMNSPRLQAYAQAFVKRVAATNPASPEAAVQAAFRLAIQRPPTADELRHSTDFLAAQARAYRERGQGNAAELALEDVCQTLFGLNEFIYID